MLDFNLSFIHSTSGLQISALGNEPAVPWNSAFIDVLFYFNIEQ